MYSRLTDKSAVFTSLSCSLLLACLVLEATAHTTAIPEYREECRVWENVTTILHRMSTRSQTVLHPQFPSLKCHKNPQCTGFDCTGHFSYTGFRGVTGSSIEVDFCFGVALHPCRHPIDMHFYTEFIHGHGGDDNYVFQKTLQHGDDIQIPGVHYDLKHLGKADGFVSVDMTVMPGKQGKPTRVKMGLKFKVRVTVAGFYTWPPDLQKTLMPDMIVPVPTCQPSVITPNHTKGSCYKFDLPKSTTVPPSGKPPSGPTSKTCVQGTARECGDYEKCVKLPIWGKGHCKCVENAKRINGQCTMGDKPKPTTIIIIDGGGLVPSTTGIPETSKGSSQVGPSTPGSANKINKNTIIIAASIGAAALIFSVVLVMVVLLYRRHRSVYQGRLLLLNNEDDDTLDNEVDT